MSPPPSSPRQLFLTLTAKCRVSFQKPSLNSLSYLVSLSVPSPAPASTLTLIGQVLLWMHQPPRNAVITLAISTYSDPPYA
jgi:hypothetical protein